jgi:hypothetical protein
VYFDGAKQPECFATKDLLLLPLWNVENGELLISSMYRIVVLQ